jgi:hypothetical protein
MDPDLKCEFITHLDTRHLRWARSFASLIAFCQGREQLFPPDLMAGIYVANFERVAALWPSAELLEDFVADKCKWSEPRWLTWQRWEYELHHAPRTLGIPFTSWFISRRKKDRFVGRRFKPSDEWKSLFAVGEQITPNHAADFQGRRLPLLTNEIMMLAMIRSEHLPISKALLESGIAVERLEEAALRHIEDPESLRF